MRWIAIFEDKPGALAIRTAQSEAHFDYLEKHRDQIRLAGGVRDEPGGPPDGGLWIGTSESGLYRFQRGVLQTFGPAEGLPERPIRRLLCDHTGALWAAPVEGPLYRLEGSRFQPLSSDSSQLRIGALAEGPDGTLWVCELFAVSQ